MLISSVSVPDTAITIPEAATRGCLVLIAWTFPESLIGGLSPWPLLHVLLPLAGFKMFAVGVGNAVEDELREIASDPVAEHYFYTADYKTINQIGRKLQKKICVGE